MTAIVAKKLREACFNALDCLYVSVDEGVATDINTKVRAYIQVLESAPKLPDFPVHATKAFEIMDMMPKKDGESDDDYLKRIAAEYGMDTYHFKEEIASGIIALVPTDIARRYHIIPIDFKDNVLTVVMSDPTDLEALDSLRYILRVDVEAAVAPKEEVDAAITKYYGDFEA